MLARLSVYRPRLGNFGEISSTLQFLQNGPGFFFGLYQDMSSLHRSPQLFGVVCVVHLFVPFLVGPGQFVEYLHPVEFLLEPGVVQSLFFLCHYGIAGQPPRLGFAHQHTPIYDNVQVVLFELLCGFLLPVLLCHETGCLAKVRCGDLLVAYPG